MNDTRVLPHLEHMAPDYKQTPEDVWNNLRESQIEDLEDKVFQVMNIMNGCCDTSHGDVVHEDVMPTLEEVYEYLKPMFE